MRAAYYGEAERALLFGFNQCRRARARSGGSAFGGFALDAAELFGVCQDKIHMLSVQILAELVEEGLGFGSWTAYFIKSEHLAGHLAAVVQCYSHAVVYL